MNIKLSALLLVGALLSGCKSTPNYDYDQSVNFSKIKTYAWIISDKQSVESKEFYQSEINQKRITRAIDQQLLAKGLQKVAPDNADVLVNYHTSVVTKRERDLSNTHPYYWSFGSGFHHSHLGFHMNLNNLERQYKAGALVVDFINPDKELIWRGAKESRVQRKASPAQRQERIDNVVADIMANFPPKGGY